MVRGTCPVSLDCTLLRGEGNPVPFTDSFVWYVKDVIAVVEVMKILHSAELIDALGQLSSVQALERNYAAIAFALVNNLGQLPVTVTLGQFANRYTTQVNLMSAALLVALPVLLLYVFFQRRFIDVVLSGALKG